MAVGAMLMAILVLVAGCGGSDPESAYRNMVQAAEEGDWGTVYDSIDKKSQGQLDMAMGMLAGLAAMGDEEAAADLQDKEPRDLFISVMESDEDIAAEFKSSDFELIDKTVEGDEAELVIKRDDGEIITVDMLKEDGVWKFSMGDIGGGASPTKETEPGASLKEAEQQAKVTAMTEALDVTVSEKGFLPADWAAGHGDYITLLLVFDNKSGKDLEGVKGSLKFKDMFGDVVKEITVSYDEPIKAKSTSEWAAQVDYNEFMDSDVKLRNTELEKLAIEWVPDTYIYADGTTLSASE
jgi:hypothetical protein